jgi:hypothetical protein
MTSLANADSVLIYPVMPLWLADRLLWDGWHLANWTVKPFLFSGLHQDWMCGLLYQSPVLRAVLGSQVDR